MVMLLADVKKVVVLEVSTTKRVVASGLIRSENKSGILKKNVSGPNPPPTLRVAYPQN